MLSMPIITAGSAGNESTFHQDHVASFHKGAFDMQKEFMREMITGAVPRPSFLTPACKNVDDNFK